MIASLNHYEKSNAPSPLGFGTAQWAIPYGIANRGVVPSEEELERILQLGLENNCQFLDTAPAYRSEQTLARLPSSHHYKLISKTIHLDGSQPLKLRVLALEKAVEESMRVLSKFRLYALLAHQSSELLAHDGDAIWEAIERMKRRFGINKIGVSVYTPAEAIEIASRYPIEIIQVPVSLADQRLTPDIAATLSAAGVEIHARSIFLQGALLMEPKTLPSHLVALSPLISNLQSLARKAKVSAARIALEFVQREKRISGVIVGAESLSQVKEFLAPLPQGLDAEISRLGDLISLPTTTLDPRLWNT